MKVEETSSANLVATPWQKPSLHRYSDGTLAPPPKTTPPTGTAACNIRCRNGGCPVAPGPAIICTECGATGAGNVSPNCTTGSRRQPSPRTGNHGVVERG